MIKSLRARHLWIVAILAIVVGTLFIAALAVRPEPAIQESFSDAVEQTPPAAGWTEDAASEAVVAGDDR